MLNCTTRKQVEKILPAFFKKWPDAASVANANVQEMVQLITPLGFGTRRSERLIKLATAYAAGDWQHVRDLPGIGEYASRMWEMFFCGILGDDAPSDGALVLYWKWRKAQESLAPAV
jgi:adenine-specific DNA glycosylase